MPNTSDTRLCPVQQRAFDSLCAGLRVGSILRLRAGCGRGKTTILRELHKQIGGAFLNTKDFVEASVKNHPLALEETLYRLLFDALQANPVVIMDDLHLLDLYSAGCHFYPRSGYFNSVMMGLCTYALEANKKLVFSTRDHLAEAAEQRSYSFGIERFKVEDYAALVATFRGAAAPELDLEKVFRFAPKLNAHQLKAGCQWLAGYKELTTDLFIDYLRSQRLASNVDLGEVQPVDLKDLKGVDDVLRSLEINIVLPLENDQLASHFRLRSKRGVLLYGPPGTGKTTVGRALAHRLKGKFFLIDGTFIAGTDNFYNRINQVFEAAKDNSPSVIFIDDADAIFEDNEERALYRYLLTMIDGLESESAGRVCVMMTAMNVANLPPALVRSGRVELWLEMKLPDPPARTDILSDHLGNLPEELREVDVANPFHAMNSPPSLVVDGALSSSRGDPGPTPLPRILVVEDEVVVAMDIQDRLESLGYTVVGRTASGEESIVLTEQTQPDLVLMDIRLQGEMDGIVAARKIRERFRRPVIFLTAYSEDATLTRAKVVEPFGYLLKPFEDRELNTAIQIALYKHQAETEILRLNRMYAGVEPRQPSHRQD